MSAQRRRSRGWWGVGAAVLVVVLVGGRLLAVETAERAWARSISGGDVYLQARNLARLFHVAVLLAAITWATSNLLFVYRAIGSVQMPRRLGDLEIVEAVPQRVLLVTTIASGLLFGLVMTWGTGEWWLTALLASSPPHFGALDPVLHRDLGYYAGTLPWLAGLQDQVLAAIASVTGVVALLYTGIGSLRWRGGRPTVSPRARAHLGFLLGGLGAALAWGALLDPAELVAGWHGAVDHAALDYRIPGAGGVAGIAAAVAALSLAWGWLGRPRLVAVGWAALLGAMLMVYAVIPATVRGASDAGAVRVPALLEGGQSLSELAYGYRWEAGDSIPQFASPAAALDALPLWDAPRVAGLANRATGGVTLTALAGPSGEARAEWLVVPAPDEAALEHARPLPSWIDVHRGAWAVTGPARLAVENDTALAFTGLATEDSVLWFGRDFSQFAVAPPREAGSGIPLVGRWRRLALAWVLQSPELARRETDGLTLLWRRQAEERLTRVAPFAAFDTPQPVEADGAIWWLAYGYVSSEGFPLVVPTRWRDRDVRYLRAGIVGAMRAATGETRVFFVPGADSVSTAWGRIFSPLVQPAESLPPALAARLRFPRETFDRAIAARLGDHGDTTTWLTVPARPYEIVAGSGTPSVWTAQAFESGRPPRLVGLAAGAMSRDGPRLLFWQSAVPGAARTGIAPVAGSTETKPGLLRLWPAGDRLLSAQTLFLERVGSNDPPRPYKVFVTWGDRAGDGPTATDALRDLLTTDVPPPGPSALAGDRWEEARRLLARADSALAAGDLERFGRLYQELKRKFQLGRRELAPAPRPD